MTPVAARWEVLRPPTSAEAARLLARRAARQELRDHHAAVVYLNFDGATIEPGAYEESDASRNVSGLIALPVDYPPFDATPFGVSAEEGRLTLVNGLRDLYAGFKIAFTDERPAAGNYSMIMIGGSPSDVGQSPGTLGMAPLDCTGGADGFALDLNPVDIVFIFSDEIARCGLGLPALEYVIAHELAHALGLAHIARAGDIMFPDIGDDSYRSWGAGPTTAGASSCAADGYQDDLDYLRQAVGPGYPQWQPPTVSITEPGDGMVVEDGWLDVAAAATSPTFVESVTFWVNGTSWASVDAPPYTTRLELPAPGVYSIRAHVADAYNSADSQVVNVFVPLPQPVTCGNDAACGSVWRCVDGRCLGPPPTPSFGVLGAACMDESDCLSGRCQSASSNYCSRACREDVGAYCPYGYSCAVDGYCESQTEIPPGGLGAPCQKDRQCQKRVCVADGEQGYCSQRCFLNGFACPLGAACLAQPDSSLYACGRPHPGGCAVGRGLPSEPGGAVAWLGAALVLAGLRRRRANRRAT
jgi:hypothetical protein